MRRVGTGVGVALLFTLTGPTVPADAATPVHTVDVRTAPELESARATADALQVRLETLQDRVDWTQERLAYARDQLAEATSRAVTADQQLATLQGVSSTAEIDIAHRVRAIEQSGGAAALFTQALDADAITDVASNVAALNGVLATDVVRASDAAASSAQMAQVRLSLAKISDERAAIAAQAKALSAQSRELLAAQRALVSAADDRVAALVAARERRAREARRGSGRPLDRRRALRTHSVRQPGDCGGALQARLALRLGD